MPRPKVAMRRIKEVLRLKEGLGLSDTAVSRSVRIARSTVKEYLDRAAAAGLNWETVAELSEEELDRRLFAAVDTRHWDRPLPDWEVTSVKLVEIRDCGLRRPDAVAPVEGCLQSVRLRAAIDGMADCAAGAAPLSSPAPDGAPLRGCGA